FDLLRAHSSAMYPSLSKHLRELTGIDNGYQVCGGIELLETPEDDTSEEWRSEGIAFEELNRTALHQREPALAPHLNRAYYLPDMAQVRNPRHVKALCAVCEVRGVRLRP